MRRAGAVALLLAIAVSACGGDDANDDGNGIALRIVNASEFEFDIKEIDVEAGRQTAVSLRNRGSLGHTWTVLRAGLTVTSAGDITDADVVVSVSADAAQSVSAEFAGPPPGTYQIICTIPGHLEAGMEATLISKGTGTALRPNSG